MTEENQELLKELERLKQENKELKENNEFTELRDKYQKIINNKETEIKNLKQENQKVQESFKAKEKELAESIGKELEASEQYKEILSTVQELKTQQAETLVQSYINKGVILPAQKQTAIKLALKDSDTFNELYKDAEPVIQIEKERTSIVPDSTIKKLNNYFKGE